MYPYVAIAGRAVTTYSIMTCVGAVFAVPLFATLLRKRYLLRLYFNGIFAAMIGVILGGKLFGTVSTLFNILKETGNFHIELAYKTSGIVYYGGLLGFLLLYKAFCMVKGVAFESITNEIAVCIPLFHFWGRIGCFLSGCCYGCEYNGVLSVLYDNGVNIVRRIPTQLIEAIFELCLFLLLLFLYFNENVNGRLMLVYLKTYAVFRFLLEFVRGDEKRGVYGNISFSQFISVVIIGVIILKSGKIHFELPKRNSVGGVVRIKSWKDFENTNTSVKTNEKAE